MHFKASKYKMDITLIRYKKFSKKTLILKIRN